MDAVNRNRHIAGNGSSAGDWLADAALAAVPEVDIARLLGDQTRVVVVAPHPDDEILTCGALLQSAAANGRDVLVVAVTDGESSHPGSPQWPQERLRQARSSETVAALACLGIAPDRLVRLGIPDGAVSAHQARLSQQLQSLLQPGDVMITTWQYDGHPDHEATARACASAAAAGGIRVLQAPVWGWHWSAPGDGAMPFGRARKLAASPPALAGKRAALLCFRSQIEADASTGAAPILPAFAMERVLHPFELYFDDHD